MATGNVPGKLTALILLDIKDKEWWLGSGLRSQPTWVSSVFLPIANLIALAGLLSSPGLCFLIYELGTVMFTA